MKLVFPDGQDFVKEQFEEHGVWESRTTDYIKKHLKAGQLFADIGAHVGYYSILASQLDAKVLAFEPSTANRALFTQNITANNCRNIKLYTQALSNQSGSGFLYTDTTPGQYSLIGNGGAETVEVVKYDDLKLPVPDFIKIDTEGNEKQVLEGMGAVLVATKPITLIIEEWSGGLSEWLINNHGFNLVTTEREFGNKILTKNQPFKPEPEPLRIHLLSLPHTETTKDYSWCAFTSLVMNMANMMSAQGHEVILYAGENNEANCSELVTCSDPPKDNSFFVPPWTYEYFAPMNNRIIEEMGKRLKFGDIILESTSLQSIVGEAFPRYLSVEYAIGYGGCRAAYRIFPSEAWRHEIYGRDANARGEDIHTVMGWASDAVVPHMLDIKQFPKGKGGDYLLFMGRLGSMKGEQVAIETSKRTGIPLKIAGPGPVPDYGEYLGVVKPEQRAELMGNALAFMCPSIFPEPFGLVAIEAQACGTPVLCTDWGAFTETVEQGVSGYRCVTVNEFVEAANKVKDLDRDKIRKRAIRLYGFDAIGPQYTKVFKRFIEIMTPQA